MSTFTQLTGIPTQVGHVPRSSKQNGSPFITGSAFAPESGKCYEVSFESIIDGQDPPNTSRIRAYGPVHSQWVNLDTNTQFQCDRKLVVQAYREISCSDCNG